LMVSLVQLDLLERKVPLDFLESVDLLVTSSLRMVKLDPKESQESKVPRDLREPEAPLESEDPVDSREIHALLAKRPKKEKRVTKGSTAYLATQELQDRQDQKELKEKMENLDLREKLVHKDPRANLVSEDELEIKEAEEKRERV